MLTPTEFHRQMLKLKDVIYDVLVNSLGCGPFDGGCVVVASAIQRVLGGELVVLVREDDKADHACVMVNDVLIDFDGALVPEAFIKRFNINEMAHTVSFRPMKEGDLPCAGRDQNAENKLVKLFQRPA